MITRAVVATLVAAALLGLGAQCSSSKNAGGGTTTAPSPATTVVMTTTSAVASGLLDVPGDMLNPAVTQATIRNTICVSGYTATIRPSTSLTSPLKAAQIAAYGYADTNPSSYEEDHVVPLELGGAPAATMNLYPEPATSSGADDKAENAFHDQVCAGVLSLQNAQQRMLALKTSHGYRRDVSVASAPVPAPVSPASTPGPTTPSAAGGPYYANCTAARAAGAAPLHRGEPGYRLPLDRDGDGIACE